MRELGFPVLRVRHHDELGKLELPAADLKRAGRQPMLQAIFVAIRSAGYARPRSIRNRFALDR